MSVGKYKGVTATSIASIGGVTSYNIAKLKGVDFSIGGWDLSDAVYSSEELNFLEWESTMKHFYFKPDGTKLYIVGENSFVGGTAGYLTGGNSAQLDYAVWEAITDASFRVKIDGVLYNIDGIDFTGVASLNNVASVIQTSIRSNTGGSEACTWHTNHFLIKSGTENSSSEVSVLLTSTGTVGTDISGVGAPTWMDADAGNGVATAGTSDYSGKYIQQFSLSRPWDITSATSDDVHFDLNDGVNVPYVSDPKGMMLKADGTRIYIISSGGATAPYARRVYSYTMSTPWDLSTLTYDSIEYDYSSLGINCHGMFFSADGDKMYLCDYGDPVDGLYARVIQLTLSTSWDVSTASDSGNSLDCTGEMGRINSFYMKSDGMRLIAVNKLVTNNEGYIVSGLNCEDDYAVWEAITDASFRVTIDGTARNIDGIDFTGDASMTDVASTIQAAIRAVTGGSEDCDWVRNHFAIMSGTTGAASEISFLTTSTGTVGTDISGLGANNWLDADSGNAYVVAGNTSFGSTMAYQYNISTPWDVSTGSYASQNWNYDTSPTEFAGQGTGIFIKADGTELFLGGITSGTWKPIGQMRLSPDWGLNNVYWYNYGDTSSQSTVVVGVALNSDGTKMYTNAYGGMVYQYSLGVAWDTRSATYDSVSYDFSGNDGNNRGIRFNSDGTKMYLCGSQHDRLYEVALSTGWDLSTATYSGVYFSLSTWADGVPHNFCFSHDGSKFYFINVNEEAYEFDLSTPWDVTSCSYSNHTYDFTSVNSQIKGMDISRDGKRIYLTGEATNKYIYEIDLSTAWDLSTASYNSVYLNVNTGKLLESSPKQVCFRPTGKKLYLSGLGGKIWQIDIY